MKEDWKEGRGKSAMKKVLTENMDETNINLNIRRGKRKHKTSRNEKVEVKNKLRKRVLEENNTAEEAEIKLKMKF